MDISQLDCSSSETVNAASFTHPINTASIFDNCNHTVSDSSAIAHAEYKRATDEFLSQVKSQSLLVFTDGSVFGEGPGYGACFVHAVT